MTDIPRALIEYILLGSGDSRRQLQDSPILGDVWIEYAEHPNRPADLLITAYKDATANQLASKIYAGVKYRPEWADEDPGIAPVQTFVAARLFFDDLLSVVVPMTKWWYEPRTKQEFEQYQTPDNGDPADVDGPAKLNDTVNDVKGLLERWAATSHDGAIKQRSPFERFVALCTLVLLAKKHIDKAVAANVPSTEAVKQLRDSNEEDISRIVFEVLKTMKRADDSKPLVFQISVNRRAAPALEKSVPTVKADAARLLFNVDCSQINWAVVDAGVDAGHPAFRKNQVKATYDFTNYRRIVSLGNEKPAVRRLNLQHIEKARGGTPIEGGEDKLEELAGNAVAGRPVRWDIVKEFVLLDQPPPQPVSPHGTHVAGIIGASKDQDNTESADGMCPGIGIYDFRILNPCTDQKDTEFAVIAALQFIRFINDQAGFMVINGVNMSLSIRHDVRNYACGGTPVCMESERLIDSGVVVVAAAGNLGYQHTMVGGSGARWLRRVQHYRPRQRRSRHHGRFDAPFRAVYLRHQLLFQPRPDR